MPRLILIFVFVLMPQFQQAQTNISCSSAAASQVMAGNYNPAAYAASTVIDHPDDIVAGMVSEINADSIHQWLSGLSSFINRNSGSDTLSSSRGIGAARRWVYSKFQQFSSRNDNRLIPAYLQFERVFCSQNLHKDVLAVLPGADTSAKGFILVEAHMDSRCASGCDTSCIAYGADDNGSGCALVMELARVFSKYTFRHTIVFMLTTGEEQGLFGAEAFADFAVQNDLNIKAVFNNDVVGGVYCGNTASFPGCSPTGAADTLNLRIFSFGGYNSPHKQLARYIKLEYKEEVQPAGALSTVVNIMAPEDRTGRSGDHIPFRQQGFTAVRFTSAFEHGDGNPTQAGYTDRQHTSGDSLGIDLDFNGSMDSFYVDFNYLRKNALVNAAGMTMAALGPRTPDFNVTDNAGTIVVDILSEQQYGKYRVGIRTAGNDWDTVYTFTGTSASISGLTPGGTHIFSVASVDTNDVESLFSHEMTLTPSTGTIPPGFNSFIHLLPNVPNPFDEETLITILVDKGFTPRDATLRITDLQGRIIQTIPVDLNPGINEVRFEFGTQSSAIYLYTLEVEGVKVGEGRMMVGR